MGFWGVSRFLDCLTFKVVNFGPSFSLRELTGPLPMIIAVYVLREKNAVKHGDSLKDYILCAAIWSSEERANFAIVQAMLSGDFDRGLTGNRRPKPEIADESHLSLEATAKSNCFLQTQACCWRRSEDS